MHLLLVNEATTQNARFCELLVQHLNNNGHQVTSTGSFANVSELAKGTAFDALIALAAPDAKNFPESSAELPMHCILVPTHDEPIEALNAVDQWLTGIKDHHGKDCLLREAGELTLDRPNRSVIFRGERIHLLEKEYQLLDVLMMHANKVVSRAMLLEHIWDYRFDPQTNIIEVHISRIRQKLRDYFSITPIVTVRGSGYRLEPV